MRSRGQQLGRALCSRSGTHSLVPEVGGSGDIRSPAKLPGGSDYPIIRLCVKEGRELNEGVVREQGAGFQSFIMATRRGPRS